VGWDYNIYDACNAFGKEPAYQFGNLGIFVIFREKGRSIRRTGIAWGYYGSGLAIKEKQYCDFKKKGKFIKFIDEWHTSFPIWRVKQPYDGVFMLNSTSDHTLK